MDVDKILNFLKTDILGLILLGLISSLIAGILYDFLKKQFQLNTQKIKKKIFVKRLVKIADSFGQGLRTTFAEYGTHFQQQVLIGDYIIKTIMLVSWIFFYLLISIILLLILDESLDWIPVVIFSIIITLRYKKLKQHLEHFKLTFENVFGDKYFEDEQKAKVEYWDKLFKKKEKTKE